jgi:hypothetical protein
VTNLVLVYAPTLVVLYGVGMACLLGYRITREQHAENVRSWPSATPRRPRIGRASIEGGLAQGVAHEYN